MEKKIRLKIIKWLANTRWGKWRMRCFTARVRALCYTSISKMPIVQWWALNEGILESLYKEEYRELGKGHKFILLQVQKELFDQFFKQFGFGEKMVEILKKEREITLLYLRKSAEDNPMLLTDIEIAEKELNKMKKDAFSEPVNLLEIIGQIESILHVTIDIDKCTTEKFYSYLKLIEKRHKK